MYKRLEVMSKMRSICEWVTGRRPTNLKNNLIFLVAMRLWDTPVPIPNTMVKT